MEQIILNRKGKSMSNDSSKHLSVTYLPINTLTPDPNNTRVHSDRQIKMLAGSMKALGFNVPIIVDTVGHIIAGHARLQAAQMSGLKEVPTICLDHLTETQLKAFRIADNRLAEMSSWDDSLLAAQLKALAEVNLDFDLETTGFTMGEIDLRIEGQKNPGDDPADALPFIAQGTPITKPGDVWLLGAHRTLCGNALDSSSYRLLMENRRAAMAFTDPPYNVKVDGHVSGLGTTRHREFAMASGEMNEAEFVSFLTRACSLMARHSIDGSIHFQCMDWRHMSEMLEAGRMAYTELKNVCVWSKDNAGMGSLYRSQYELVFVFKHGRAVHRNNVELGKHGRYRTNVWQYAGANSFSRKSEEGDLLKLHPTVKPVAMVADAILDVSARGDIVLDSFLGSGTTLMAAERTGRICYGMELDPLYVDTAIRRWQTYTGGIAIHAASGKSFDDIPAAAEMRYD
jgi:DNA modification methylase